MLRHKKQGCTQAYSFIDIYRTVKRLHALEHSLRQIAKEQFDGQITHATVQRILDGREPKDPKIRMAIGLPAYQGVTVVTGDILPPGTQSIGALLCPCGRWFIPNTGKRKRCFVCTPFRKRRL